MTPTGSAEPVPTTIISERPTEAYTQGHDDGVTGAREAVERILNGKDTGSGVCCEAKWEAMRRRLLAMVASKELLRDERSAWEKMIIAEKEYKSARKEWEEASAKRIRYLEGNPVMVGR